MNPLFTRLIGAIYLRYRVTNAMERHAWHQLQITHGGREPAKAYLEERKRQIVLRTYDDTDEAQIMVMSATRIVDDLREWFGPYQADADAMDEELDLENPVTQVVLGCFQALHRECFENHQEWWETFVAKKNGDEAQAEGELDVLWATLADSLPLEELQKVLLTETLNLVEAPEPRMGGRGPLPEPN